MEAGAITKTEQRRLDREARAKAKTQEKITRVTGQLCRQIEKHIEKNKQYEAARERRRILKADLLEYLAGQHTKDARSLAARIKKEW